MMAVDYNWPEVAGNFSKAIQSWMWMKRMLSRGGADPKVLGLFSKAVV